MAKTSAGILAYRRTAEIPEILLVHPGGPFYAKKDEGAWSIPKGEFTPDEEPLSAARREFFEETGFTVDGDFIPLGEVKQAGGKIVHAWAVETDLDTAAIRSNLVKMELPRNSGRFIEFPEIDRAAWLTFAEARLKLLPAQIPFLTRLEAILAAGVE